MLKRNDVIAPGVQELRRVSIVDWDGVIDLEPDDGWIPILLTLVGHRHDRRLASRERSGDRLLKVSCERRNPTAARQRIPYECDLSSFRHSCNSVLLPRGEAANPHNRLPRDGRSADVERFPATGKRAGPG
jgi:hypothetical protein